MDLVYQSHITCERWETVNGSRQTLNKEQSTQNSSLPRFGSSFAARR
jgi:hypothetical protein